MTEGTQGVMTCAICKATDHGGDQRGGAYDWPAHHAEAFTNPVTREQYEVPADIKAIATRITQSYGLRGICDPMYIANVIGTETGRGDGAGTFAA